MSAVNQRQGQHVRVPRELYAFFKGEREIMAYFETLAAKTDNSSGGLADAEFVPQPVFSGETEELAKHVDDILRMQFFASFDEIIKRCEDLERRLATIPDLSEIEKKLDDLRKMER